MPYQHCPTCRLTVATGATECPRCGSALVARLVPAPLDPRAVRAALVKRGGRFRPPPSRTGRFEPVGRRDRSG
jgi:hypothetical protein